MMNREQNRQPIGHGYVAETGGDDAWWEIYHESDLSRRVATADTLPGAVAWACGVGQTRRRRTVRFWTWVNGWVKLTLKPGQELTWRMWERTEEGHAWEQNSWTHRGDVITLAHASGGRDCDGGHEHSQWRYTRVEDLHEVESYDKATLDGKVIRRPRWHEDRPSRNWDQFAEAAGY